MTIQHFMAQGQRSDTNDVHEERIKLDLLWMRDHHPIFKLMERNTVQRKQSEDEYKTLLPVKP